jgi:uncharacterized membrane protein YbjE (DUF340 family)
MALSLLPGIFLLLIHQEAGGNWEKNCMYVVAVILKQCRFATEVTGLNALTDHRMWEILLIFCLGLATGFVVKKRFDIRRTVGWLTEWAVYFLLFFLGIAVGLNKTIINNMGTIGFYGILFSVAAVFFSVVIAGWIYSKFFKGVHEK